MLYSKFMTARFAAAKSKKFLLMGLACLLGLGAVVALMDGTSSTRQYPQNNSGEYIAEDNAQLTNIKNLAEDQDSSGSQKNTNPQTASGLAEPSGSFVSNHQVTPESNIESLCITTAGATCKIVISRGPLVKTLEAKSTDDKGIASWIWQPQKIGISGGSWQIQAIASKNGESKQSTDPKRLEVSP